ncbi:hypothetical protein ANCCEY_12297 [Ancylostoma ceylanicum]|uniref:Uncharacterized protein n=1 Tax=Ancylostoma ceylanicum TaxID=53326 RepID=A0A0D6LLV5_9BILA|nr:hypothetical protein ANCCEY_12297 [Ancylostoma ceylanicum]
MHKYQKNVDVKVYESLDDFHTPSAGSPRDGASSPSVSDSLPSTLYPLGHPEICMIVNTCEIFEELHRLCVNEDDFSQDESEPVGSQGTPTGEESELDEFSE